MMTRKADSDNDLEDDSEGSLGQETLDPEEVAARREEIKRLSVAVALSAKGDRDAAAEQLVEIIRRDRSWNDQAARKQLLQLFEAWGLMDPAAVAARRKLSAIWF